MNGDDQTSSQSSSGGGAGGTFGLTSAPHAFPDFTFKRFFDQDNNNSSNGASAGDDTNPLGFAAAKASNLCASEVWPQANALLNPPASSTSTSFQ